MSNYLKMKDERLSEKESWKYLSRDFKLVSVDEVSVIRIRMIKQFIHSEDKCRLVYIDIDL
jgi:hypothetical protein